jgi:hypothetical protein
MGAAVGGSTAIAVDIDVRSKDSGVSPTTFVSRPSPHPRPYMDCYAAGRRSISAVLYVSLSSVGEG